MPRFRGAGDSRPPVREEEARGPADSRSVARPGCVELFDVWFGFGDHEILRGISFQVSDGGILCVLGGSGEGKTTILRLILRLLRPDKGEIYVEGRNIAEASTKEVAALREHIGMVFQGSALFDSLSIFDNVAFPLREHTDLDEESIRARVEEVLCFVDLEMDQVANLLPAELSGGMRKRVGIARAIVHEPDILLFDEPTSGLDPITTRTINQLILKLQREMGVCAVVVTHDIRSATQIATRMALLREGKIVFMGAPEEMFSSEDEYVRAFVS